MKIFFSILIFSLIQSAIALDEYYCKIEFTAAITTLYSLVDNYF